MTVTVNTSATESHTWTSVAIVCLTDSGDLNLIYEDEYGARHTVTEKSAFVITISKPVEST